MFAPQSPMAPKLLLPSLLPGSKPLQRVSSLLITAGLLLGGSLQAQSGKDQVGWTDKSGRAKTFTGIITENSLERTVIQVGDNERRVDSDAVTLVSFGAVPPAYAEGVAYFDRNDFSTAAARFQVAATDASASESVRAAARFRSGQAWMRASTQSSDAFANAVDQLERFVSDHPSNRSLPLATFYLGRAKWLGGDSQAAAELLRGLFQNRETAGYPAVVSYQAGTVAAQALIAAGDAASAKSLFAEVQPALASHLASLDSADSQRFRLSNIEADALLGEGFCLLAEGKASQAKSFFNSKLSSAPGSSALAHGARLGLAESLLAEGETRAAQLEFAKVSALDYSSSDRVARAMLGLAECALKLPDSSSSADAKLLLQSIQDQFGDTPSVLRAAELLKSL